MVIAGDMSAGPVLLRIINSFLSCEQTLLIGENYNRVEGGTLPQEKSHCTHSGGKTIAELPRFRRAWN
jgi:hypothetical protein